MARITEEQKVQINELYSENKNKSLTARIMGISPASVSRYIIPNYISVKDRKIEKFNGRPTDFSSELLAIEDNTDFALALIQLSPEEKEDLQNLQKGIFI